MKELRYTLVSEGSSDRALLPMLTWLLQQNEVSMPISPVWADFGLRRDSSRRLAEKVRVGLDLYPCDLLFVHRDADREKRQVRVDEIHLALAESEAVEVPPAVCVIPVRMLEAWLLFDELAIRKAAGNPNGSERLVLPKLSSVEKLPDPKSVLRDLFRAASGRQKRRLKQLSIGQCVHRLVEEIGDFAPLRALSAFAVLEQDIAQKVREHSWASK